MEWLPSILLITVVAAITLFVLKEVLEFIKRWRVDRRKGQAYRKLLARECELNLWTQWRLEETSREIQQDAERAVKAEYTIRTLPNGDVEWRRSAGAEYGGGTLSDAHTNLMRGMLH